MTRKNNKDEVVSVAFTEDQFQRIQAKASEAGISPGQWLENWVWEHRATMNPVKRSLHQHLKTERVHFRLTRQRYQALKHYAKQQGWERNLSQFICYSLFPTKPVPQKPDGRRKPSTWTPEEQAEYDREMAANDAASKEWSEMVESTRNPTGKIMSRDGTRFRLQLCFKAAEHKLEEELGLTKDEWFNRRRKGLLAQDRKQALVKHRKAA